MESFEFAITPSGILRRRIVEEAVTEEVANLLLNQLARDFVVVTPNLIEPGDAFSALHAIATPGGDVWYAAKVRKLTFNGFWSAEADRVYPSPSGETAIPDAAAFTVPVPIPLFVFINPKRRTLLMLAFLVQRLEDGTERKAWARLPFPNTYSDGKLCPGELPAFDEHASFATNALDMLEAWTSNPWNEDLCGSDTHSFLRTIGSFHLPEGEALEATAADWAAYADIVNPGIEVVSAAFEPLFALYGKEAAGVGRQ